MTIFLPVRLTVKDSDIGEDLERQVEDLKNLVAAYKNALIKERFN